MMGKIFSTSLKLYVPDGIWHRIALEREIGNFCKIHGIEFVDELLSSGMNDSGNHYFELVYHLSKMVHGNGESLALLKSVEELVYTLRIDVPILETNIRYLDPWILQDQS